MEESDHTQAVSAPSSSTLAVGASSSSSSSSPVLGEPQGEQLEDGNDHRQFYLPPQEQQRQPSSVSYRVNISISDVATGEIRDDVWSCLVVLVTFWFFGTGIDEPKPGPMLYGFYEPPPLDVENTWFETHDASVEANFHKEWIFFLNKGSEVDISYSVKAPRSSPLSLVIAQGRESLVEWIEDPSYPNTTLSWNIIYGSGKVQQEIFKSSYYYVAVGNLNSEEVKVQLNLTMKTFLYNTTKAYYKCSLGNRLCSLKLFLLRANSAVLTSPGHVLECTEWTVIVVQGSSNDDWLIKMSYGPRWITYFVGSGAMTVLILLAFRACNTFQTIIGDGTGYQVGTGETEPERAPLLLPKDDDASSWGSSYDSISHDEEDLEEWLAVSSLEGNISKEGENNGNPRRLCVICCDAPRDCFFLPCGHCAACFTCGTRISEEADTPGEEEEVDGFLWYSLVPFCKNSPGLEYFWLQCGCNPITLVLQYGEQRSHCGVMAMTAILSAVVVTIVFGVTFDYWLFLM
ncbi:hypothetical protein CK203_086727 [Vitis vinifera]|uniref:E3 ubiquitin-protein ligase APD1-4 middle domain-containing protein n=1 Tax=Vitis vinifera TaxID=29760 RepID=A0A438F9D7_VITVI|nr:hypothetical protein CK203_086727 [Vitis vinifera]